MNLFGIGAIVDTVGKIADDLITTDQERAQLALEARKLDLEEQRISQTTDLAQIEVNKAEAANPNVFVSGWRPAIGWVGVAALAYQFLAYPAALWIWTYLQGAGWIPRELQPPPILDTDHLWVILSGILGIAGMRTVEKAKGVASR